MFAPIDRAPYTTGYPASIPTDLPIINCADMTFIHIFIRLYCQQCLRLQNSSWPLFISVLRLEDSGSSSAVIQREASTSLVIAKVKFSSIYPF